MKDKRKCSYKQTELINFINMYMCKHNRFNEMKEASNMNMTDAREYIMDKIEWANRMDSISKWRCIPDECDLNGEK